MTDAGATTDSGRQLRTSSLRRRLIVSTLLAVLVVLAGAVVATDLLVGAQLTSSATARLVEKTNSARDSLASGSDPAAVVSAAQSDGITAQLTTSDGRVYGNRDLVPGQIAAPPPLPDPPDRTAGAAPASPPVPPDPPRPGGSEERVESTVLADGSLLTVAVDTAAISAVRTQLRTVLIAVFVVAAILVALLVIVTVRRALVPIDRMTDLARRIAGGNRGGRLSPDRDDTELGRAASAFDAMLDSLEAAEKNERAAFVRNRQFFDDAAHELRTPIAGVRAAAEALIRTGPDGSPESREQLQVLVVRESRRASRLIDDLLALARIDEGIEMNLEPVDVRALVDADADRLRVAAPGRRVETSGAAPSPVEADPLRIAQILANLTNNAQLYSPPESVVSIAVSESDGRIHVRVRDSGVGVPIADRDRIFERMVRLDGSRASGNGGSGLGLSIARALARAHGGNVTCHGNEPDTGCTFDFSLPVHTVAADRNSESLPGR